MNELIALVKMNGDKALVLKDKINLVYERHNNLLIGMDETKTFVSCLIYDSPKFGKAFAGHEFDITLTTGEVIHCTGQWWDGGYTRAEEILGKELVSVAANDIKSLQKTYGYSGYHAVKEKLGELVSEYKGKIFNYHEFEEEYFTKVSREEFIEEEWANGKKMRIRRSWMESVVNPDFINEPQ